MNSDQSVVERLQEAYEVLQDEVHHAPQARTSSQIRKVWVSVDDVSVFFFSGWVFGHQNLGT